MSGMTVGEFARALYERHCGELSAAARAGVDELHRDGEILVLAIDMIDYGVSHRFLSDDEARQALVFAREGRLSKSSGDLAERLAAYLSVAA